MFPKEIERIISGLQYTKDKVGCSGDEVYLFENKFVLKVSTDSLRLQRERKETIGFLSIFRGRKVFAI